MYETHAVGIANINQLGKRYRLEGPLTAEGSFGSDIMQMIHGRFEKLCSLIQFVIALAKVGKLVTFRRYLNSFYLRAFIRRFNALLFDHFGFRFLGKKWPIAVQEQS